MKLAIDYYTDPLCSWSWALEPSLRWLHYAYGAQLGWRVRLGAMIDGARFSDPLQDIHSPAQWAPQWFDVARQTGMPLQPSLWHDDPPHESVSACLAVAAAGLQGEVAARDYLRRLREAAMLGARNIARREVQLELAAGVDGLDAGRLAADLGAAASHDALRSDLMHVRYLRLNRFPALVVTRAAADPRQRRMLIVGWRSREALVEALVHACDGRLEPVREPDDVDGFLDTVASITAAELSLIFSLSREDACTILERYVSSGRLVAAGDVAREHALYRRAPRQGAA